MHVGFKTGPLTWAEGQQIIAEEGADLCEVWFHVNKASEYEEMFSWLERNNVRVGLHHWGLCRNSIKPNLATSDEGIRQETIQQIKQTIDIAALHGHVYVNAHPGSECLETLSFHPLRQELLADQRCSKAQARENFFSSIDELQSYAKNKQVLLTVETMVGTEQQDQSDRNGIYNPGTIDLETLQAYTSRGYALANDITHTLASITLIQGDTNALWPKAYEFSASTAAATRLLHINRVVPPYNGTDSHTGITNADWQLDGLPTLPQLKQFLSLYKDRDDVFVIPEPERDMQLNYHALRELVSLIEA